MKRIRGAFAPSVGLGVLLAAAGEDSARNAAVTLAVRSTN
jgi:hypothetical protein